MDSFSNFLYSFGAARKLLEKAHSTGSLIEGLVLYVSLIDGLLRIAIILDKQLKDDSHDFDFSYVEFSNSGPKYTEKQIYQEAFGRGIITEQLRTDITELYENRNAVVHRFFLTSLKYLNLEGWLDSYEEIYEQCYRIVHDLESRQLRAGKGMTRTGPQSDRERITKAVSAKLGLDFNT